MIFSIDFKTRWSDFDANIHMRHTAYNDYAAETRMRLFSENGITVKDFAKENVGPILFEEHTSFRKEIHLGENITSVLKVKALSSKGERWKLEHTILNGQGEVSAIINVYGAWIDLTKRKLTTPPEKLFKIFDQIKKTDDYERIILKGEK